LKEEKLIFSIAGGFNQNNNFGGGMNTYQQGTTTTASDITTPFDF